MAEISFHTTYSDKQYLLSRAKNGSESGLRSGVSYRFGFNGKENDNEIKGTGNSIDFGARMYDSRLGRFLSPDKHEAKYPSISTYTFVANNPVCIIDPDGNDLLIFFEVTYFGKTYICSWKFDGTNYDDAPNAPYVQKVLNAYRYNVENGGGDAIKEAATNSDIEVNIIETKNNSRFEFGQNTIWWNSKNGTMTEDGKFLSPATALDHEAKHKLQALLNTYWKRTSQDREDEVTQGTESNTAAKNGEVSIGYSRKGNTGFNVIMKSETSNEVDVEKTINWYKGMGWDTEKLVNAFDKYVNTEKSDDKK
jgi:RHS repeat-associated protein